MNAIEMKPYRCHKEVTAAKITAINGEMLEFAEMLPVHAEPDWIARHKPEVGGYLVRYEDGYHSFSPAKAFEAGYSEI